MAPVDSLTQNRMLHASGFYVVKRTAGLLGVWEHAIKREATLKLILNGVAPD